MQHNAIRAHGLQTIQEIPNIERDLHGIATESGGQGFGATADILSIGRDLHQALIGFAAEFDDVVVLIRQNRDALEGSNQPATVQSQAPAEPVRNELAIVGIGALQRATRHHLISSEKHHLSAITEQADRLLRTPTGHQTLHLTQRSGGKGDREISRLLASVVSDIVLSGGLISSWIRLQRILDLQNREAVSVSSSRFQGALIELKMNAGQQLLGFISAAGKQGAFGKLPPIQWLGA